MPSRSKNKHFLPDYSIPPQSWSNQRVRDSYSIRDAVWQPETPPLSASKISPWMMRHSETRSHHYRSTARAKVLDYCGCASSWVVSRFEISPSQCISQFSHSEMALR